MKAFFHWLWDQGAYYLSYYFWQTFAIAALHVVGFYIGRKFRPGIKTTEEPEMLEGKEVEGKIGDIGSYYGDITPDIKLDAGAELAFEKDMLAALPGGLKVKASLNFQVEGDPVAIALMEIGKSSNPIMKFLGEQLSKLRAGEEVHPAVVAAASPAADQAAAPQS